MGAWGTGIMENDDAMDWLLDCESAGAVHLHAALDTIVSSAQGGYLEAPEGAAALAAAETIATVAGHPSVSMQKEDIDQLLECLKPSEIEKPLLDKAKRAADLITAENSELYELWMETDNADKWLAIVAALKLRLEAVEL